MFAWYRPHPPRQAQALVNNKRNVTELLLKDHVYLNHHYRVDFTFLKLGLEGVLTGI
jgi:hypothetical protein